MPPMQQMPPAGPPSPQFNMDYLNQISATPQKPSFFSKKQLFLLIGLGAAVLLVIILSLVATSRPRSADRIAVLLPATQRIAEESQDNLKNSTLRSLNSSLILYLKEASRDLPTVYSVPETAAAQTAGVDGDALVLERLEDARLNAVYDRTYVREMTYRLEVTLALLGQMQKNASSAAATEYLNPVIENLTSAYTSLGSYEDTTN